MFPQECSLLLSFDEVHDLVVHDKHNSGTGSSENVSERALEETLWAFVLHDLGEAVSHAVVHLLGLWLGGFVLESSLHSIKRISSDTGDRHSNLGDDKLGEDSDEGNVFLIWVEGLDGILETELGTSVNDDTNGGWTDSIVERSDTVELDGLLQAIDDTGVLLDSSDIGTEGSTDIDEWVN